MVACGFYLVGRVSRNSNSNCPSVKSLNKCGTVIVHKVNKLTFSILKSGTVLLTYKSFLTVLGGTVWDTLRQAICLPCCFFYSLYLPAKATHTMAGA